VIAYFAGHPTAANLLMAGILVLGLIAAPTLKRETFPEFAATEAEIRVAYPGATAGEVEQAICERLEDAVEGVDDVAEMRCEARESLATMVVQMRPGADIGRFLDEIRTEVDAIDDFPAEAEAPRVRELGRTDHVVAVAISGPMADLDLESYALDVKARMLRAGIGSQIRVSGFAGRQIRIELSPERLRQLGLTVADVAAAVERQSLDLPAGTIRAEEQELLVRFADERRRVDEVEDLVVLAAPGGAELTLGDIALVEERFEDDERKILVDGERAAVLEVQKSRAQDSLDVLADVRAFLDRERAVAPPGVTFALTQDVASIVQDRLTMVVVNGVQGLVLVLLTMWVFFRLRYALWVAMALPVSFLGALFVMAWIDYSLNMITLVALLVAIGLLIDNAIVISENIATKLQEGLAPLRAALEGTREVAPGVTASFLTTIAVFLPLAFLEGEIGTVLAVIPVVLIVTLSVSFLEAFLILPNHLARTARRAEPAPSRLRRGFESAFAATRERWLGRLVDAAVRLRYLTLGLVGGLMLLSTGMIASGQLGFMAFPDIDGDMVEARLLLPQGTPLARTEALTGRLTDALAEVDAELTPLQPDGQPLVRHVSVRYGVNADAFESGPHLATVTVDLLGAERRTVTLDDIVARWQQALGEIPDVISLAFKEPGIGPGGHAIEFRLEGHDLEQLKAAAVELEGWLGGYVGTRDLLDDLRPGKPELRLSLRPGATALGLDAAAIAAQLRAAFFGLTAREVQRDGEALEIDLRLGALRRDRLDALDDFTITGQGGAQIPLQVLARIEEDRGWARIQRIDRVRTVTLRGDVDTRIANADAIIQDTLARFAPELSERFPGVELRLGGQAEDAGATGASLLRGFAVGLVGVFLLLSFVFRSYLEPVVVMTTIPLALIGVVWGHLLMGLELSMPSMVGLASLAGIVVNNAILLVAFIKLNHDRGMAIAEAATQASRDRFRPVVLTTLTTVAGVAPLLLETSAQAQVLIPLVASLAFGLLTAAALVLVLVPALYTILDDLGLTTLEREPAAEDAIRGSTTHA
jgi:hydrophobic/amphiphilic exporter-1 (mainly G- bacteria), HAE1 family